MTTSTKPRTTPMSTIEEMVETFCEADFGGGNEPWTEFCKRVPNLANGHRDDVRRGLLAVIEKHIGPMLAETWAEARTYEAAYSEGENDGQEFGRGHAARILSALTATGRE